LKPITRGWKNWGLIIEITGRSKAGMLECENAGMEEWVIE